MQTRKKNNGAETDRIYVRKGRPRMMDKEPFWKGKTDYHTSIVMDRSQYEKIVSAANERRCTVKEMMYRLVEASVAADTDLYEMVLQAASLSGNDVGTFIKRALKKGIHCLENEN